MLKTKLLHPQILAACARAGHGSKVLISDGNFPHSTKKGPGAELVYLNLAPGLVTVTDVLKVLVPVIPIENAEIMDYARTGPYVSKNRPPIWDEFRAILRENGFSADLVKLEPFQFYDAAGSKDVCLIVATGDERIYANLLLTIGAIRPVQK